MRRLARVISGFGAVGLFGLLVANGSAAFSSTLGASTPTSYTCQGPSFPTDAPPAIVPGGTYQNLTIQGLCDVGPAGPVTVLGTLTVQANGALDATSKATITVHGNMIIGSNAVVLLGCGGRDGGPCEDGGTKGVPRINGNVIATDANAVIVHNAIVGGNFIQAGGGGGLSCDPSPLGFPWFSTVEDSTIGGNVSVSGVHSCWMGIIHNHVSGTVSVTSNQLADPDAIEVNSNVIAQNLVCSGNSMVWDSNELGNGLYPRHWDPNTVAGVRAGQCVVAPPLKPGARSPGAF